MTRATPFSHSIPSTLRAPVIWLRRRFNRFAQSSSQCQSRALYHRSCSYFCRRGFSGHACHYHRLRFYLQFYRAMEWRGAGLYIEFLHKHDRHSNRISPLRRRCCAIYRRKPRSRRRHLHANQFFREQSRPGHHFGSAIHRADRPRRHHHRHRYRIRGQLRRAVERLRPPHHVHQQHAAKSGPDRCRLAVPRLGLYHCKQSRPFRCYQSRRCSAVTSQPIPMIQSVVISNGPGVSGNCPFLQVNITGQNFNQASVILANSTLLQTVPTAPDVVIGVFPNGFVSQPGALTFSVMNESGVVSDPFVYLPASPAALALCASPSPTTVFAGSSFSFTLQPTEINISGNVAVTLGTLPAGITTGSNSIRSRLRNHGPLQCGQHYRRWALRSGLERCGWRYNHQR